MVFLAVGPGRPLGKQHQHHVNDYSPRYNLCVSSERGLLYFPYNQRHQAEQFLFLVRMWHFEARIELLKSDS